MDTVVGAEGCNHPQNFMTPPTEAKNKSNDKTSQIKPDFERHLIVYSTPEKLANSHAMALIWVTLNWCS